MSQFYHVTTQRSTSVTKALTGNFTSPNDLNLLIIKNSYLELYDVTSEGLKLIHDVPLNASVLTALFFRQKLWRRDFLFILTHKADIAIIECIRKNDSIEFVTIMSASIADSAARMLDQGFDALVDPGATYIVIRMYYGMLKLIPIANLSGPRDPLNKVDQQAMSISVRIEETQIVDMVFLHGYATPTFALIYEDDMVASIKMYDIFGKDPILRSVPVNVDSIETSSKILIPVPAPYNGFILVGDSIICYHTRETFHISQYIPQAQNSRIVCYAKVDSRRYLLGDIAGRLYMVHLLPQDEKTIRPIPSTSRDMTHASPRIGSIRIELLGETAIPESIVYLDNGVVFIGSYLGDSQLIQLNPEIDPDKNSYITILEEFTNIGPIVDMVFFENDGQSQLITCSGCYKEGSLRVIRNGIGIQERATIDRVDIKGVWCFQLKSDTYDDSIIVSLINRSQLACIAEDCLASLTLEGFILAEQTLHCDVVYPSGYKQNPRSLLLQATTYGLRLIGIQGLMGRGCLAKWRSPTDRSVSSLASHGDYVVVASGSDLFALRITGTPEAPEFTQIGNAALPHEVACVDLTPFDRSVAAKAAIYSSAFQSPVSSVKPSVRIGNNEEEAMDSSNSGDPLDDLEPEYVVVGMWMGHGVALLKLPSLEVVCIEPLPTMTPTSGIAILPRSITIAQFEGLTYLFTVTGDGSLYYYNLDCSTEKIVIREAKRLSAGTGPQMRLTQWRSHGKRNVFVCSNRPCIVYSNRHKLVFSNVNIKEVSFMSPLNGFHYKDCICMVTPSGLMIGSVDNLQKLHVRRIPLNETPRRLALQSATNSLGVISCRREVFQEGTGFKPIRTSASLSPKVPRSYSSTPKSPASSSNPEKCTDIEASSLLIYNQSTMDLQFVHTFHYSQVVVETAMSIGSVDLGIDAGVLYAVGTALIVKGEHDPKKGRIHLLRWNPVALSLESVLTYDVPGTVFRVIEFNGRILAAIGSSVRLFEFCGDTLRQDSTFNDNIMSLYLRTKGDYVLIGDLMRSLCLLLYKPNRSNFEVIGRHHCPRYTSGIEIIDDEHFLSGDADGNIHVLGRNLPGNTDEPVVPSLRVTEAATSPTPVTVSVSTPKPMADTPDVAGPCDAADNSSVSTSTSAPETAPAQDSEEQPGVSLQAPTPQSIDLPRCPSSDGKALVDCAYMHTGESINVFVRGNMNTLGVDRWSAIGETHTMYGTAQGCLGLVAHLSPILFAFLKEVESRLSRLIVPVGNFSQESWRSCKDCLWTVRVAHNIIDGELIESFLDLSLDDKNKVVQGLKIPASMEDFGTAGLSKFNENVETKDCTVNDLMRVVEELAALH